MNKWIVNTVAITAILVSTVACKGDAKNETDTTHAKEVATPTAQATTYTVDSAASKITWKGSKPAGTHEGTINVQSGSVQVAADNSITGSFIIAMNSITVTDLEGDGKASLEAHLKGEAEGKEDHFFNVAKHPTASFEVTGVSEKEGVRTMQGNLTIKGITKNIEFPVAYTVGGDTMTLASKPFTIDRTKWGIEFMSKSVFDDLKDKFISDDIEIAISIKAKKA
ncbi:YceI family protein [uncultured Dokdonia sp.]|uniref:YceI family protein n=1 Tax=uncultured Dokdonia sp. TaxID=575653 RepID=UPI00262442C9|nr:YceI family protein [uncultured Dokdonia sp.]